MSSQSTESPIQLALKYLKNGDFQKSIKILGITEEQANKYDYVNCMMNLEQGLNLLFSGHHSQSVEPLRKAIPLINITNDNEAKFIVPTLADFAEGVSLLIQGDAHNAVKLFKLSNDAIHRVNFFKPGLEKFLLSCKAAGEVAIARTYMNIGDLASVESSFGNVTQIHEELLSKLDKTNQGDFPLFNEIFGTQIEFSLIFMRLDLEVLDFNALAKRVEFTKKNMKQLDSFMDATPHNPIKIVLEIFQILYEVFESYSRIGKNIITERLPLTKIEINELSIVDKKLFEAHQKANHAGDRGKALLYTINQLKRVNGNFFNIGKVQKTDFGRMSGIIAFGTLIILITTVNSTIKPSGNGAIMFFIGEIIVSLIAGFGYGALKFKPLLNFYSKATQAIKDNKTRQE